MTLQHHRRIPHRVALAGLLATAIAGLALFSSSASAQPDVPGMQIYACSPTADGPKWRLVAPRAELYGDNGQLLATHFGGPSWQARDGSWVKGQRVDGVTVDPGAIQWLLIKAVTPTAGPDGDRLAGTTFIQRIATTGGLEPAAAECHSDAIGTEREIPYTADYRFWKALDG